MEPSRGLYGDFEDGILRGRVGVRRWLVQSVLCFVLAIGVCTMVVTFLLSEALLLFVVTLLVSGFLFASLKFCLHPWAWLGLDRHVPILFDLRSSGLEVGTWDYCFLRRRNIPASRLKDLRVYKEVVDSSERISDAVPISSIDKVQGELPSSCDATKACVGTCWRSCCMPGSGMPVAGVFLGAKVEGDLSRGPVRLTRDVWTSKEVSRLLLMAQRGRELLGLPEDLSLHNHRADASTNVEAASDVEAPTIPIQVIDMDGAMTFGKDHDTIRETSNTSLGFQEGLPTISEDAVLREPSAQSTEASAAIAKEATSESSSVSLVRSGVSAPRPKMKSQAKGQDLLTV